MPGPLPDALVLGATSRDLTLDAPGVPELPGGVVVHAGLALARLGARARVITRLNAADAGHLLAPLVAEQVETLALPSRCTTTYANAYGDGGDRHELRAVSDPIGPDDVPLAWRAAPVVQLGPLHPDDLHPETAAVLRGLRGLDVQGLVRVPGGRNLGVGATLGAFLAHADVVQASEPELAVALAGATVSAFVARHGVRELVVTRGARGATVFTAAGAIDVPAAATAGARAGAGDVFLATYLLGRATGRDPGGAAAAAARVAALHCVHGIVPRGTRL